MEKNLTKKASDFKKSKYHIRRKTTDTMSQRKGIWKILLLRRSEFEIFQPSRYSNGIKEIFKTIVAYPYQDPYVYENPGYGPGLSSQIGKKTLIFTVLRFRYDSRQRHGSADPKCQGSATLIKTIPVGPQGFPNFGRIYTTARNSKKKYLTICTCLISV